MKGWCYYLGFVKTRHTFLAITAHEFGTLQATNFVQFCGGNGRGLEELLSDAGPPLVGME